jgi:hypothetical protein
VVDGAERSIIGTGGSLERTRSLTNCDFSNATRNPSVDLVREGRAGERQLRWVTALRRFPARC